MMGFSRETRIRALVAAARHCCACHRYKGVKVEVHHIIHQNQGGSDEYENAIALCFDCHTDAGHYNPKHPRGTRYSPAELARHREAWYEIVKSNGIRWPTEKDLLYCRYLVCQDENAFKEISLGDFSKLPFGDCVLVKNSTLGFQKKLFTLQGSDEYETTITWGKTYATKEQYSIEHPEAQTFDKSEEAFPYFEATRKPTHDELKEHVSNRLAHILLDSGVRSSEVAQASVSDEACVDDPEDRTLQEVYRLRPVWATYLAVTNLAGEQITLTSIEGIHDNPPNLSYRPFERPPDHNSTILRLPPAPLLPNSTVFIPLATVLGPFDEFEFPEWSESRNEVPIDFPDGPESQSQAVLHTSFSKSTSRANLIGPATWPSGVRFTIQGTEIIQEVHELDLSNLYTLNRYWEMGSCPHLFFRDQQTLRLVYSRELFGNGQGKSQTERIIVPSDVDEIVIAELEQEHTFIEEIRDNKTNGLRGIQLSHGDVFRMNVTPNTTLFITGYYEAKMKTMPRLLDPWRKNQLVVRFLRRATNL